MKILTYLQARDDVPEGLTEAEVARVLTIAGKAHEWIGKVGAAVRKHPEYNDVQIVEMTGMGREVVRQTPRAEWVYLVNPSLAPEEAYIAKEQILVNGKLFSPALAAWLSAGEMGTIYRLSQRAFTKEEARCARLLWQKQEQIVDRETIATAIWGDTWSEQYSDWGIDAAISRFRKKLDGQWQLFTIKGRGYMLAASVKPTGALSAVLGRETPVTAIPDSIYPTDEYLKYMNDQTRVRKVYKDLFEAMRHEKITNHKFSNSQINILCVNSYSYDNVDAVAQWIKDRGLRDVKVYFTHYDPRAIELHRKRIEELTLASQFTVLYDDLRESKLQNESMDLVINDFRLNFNQNDNQNRAVLAHTRRILRDGGVAIISAVVDGKYENQRYGKDQEKAPINAQRPGQFQADEHLVRRCWSVPYYRQLFTKAGFSDISEFDIEEGRRWGAGSVSSTVDPWCGPYYRRWVLSKDKKE